MQKRGLVGRRLHVEKKSRANFCSDLVNLSIDQPEGGDQVDASITSTTALDTKIPIPRYQYQDTNTKIPRSVLWEGISL